MYGVSGRWLLFRWRRRLLLRRVSRLRLLIFHGMARRLVIVTSMKKRLNFLLTVTLIRRRRPICVHRRRLISMIWTFGMIRERFTRGIMFPMMGNITRIPVLHWRPRRPLFIGRQLVRFLLFTRSSNRPPFRLLRGRLTPLVRRLKFILKTLFPAFTLLR